MISNITYTTNILYVKCNNVMIRMKVVVGSIKSVAIFKKFSIIQ